MKDIEVTSSALTVNPHPELAGDMTITLNETKIRSNYQGFSRFQPEHARLSLPEEYKAALEKKLRCPLLSNCGYERCCGAVEQAFRRVVLEGSGEDSEIRLVDLKNIVLNELRSDPLFSHLTGNGRTADPFDSVLFKLLKALYMTGVFCKSKSSGRDHVPDLFNNNPSLSVFYSDHPDLMERLYFSMFYILKTYDLPLEPDALSELFFGANSEEGAARMKDLLERYARETSRGAAPERPSEFRSADPDPEESPEESPEDQEEYAPDDGDELSLEAQTDFSGSFGGEGGLQGSPAAPNGGGSMEPDFSAVRRKKKKDED